jgi:hypothetical protein
LASPEHLELQARRREGAQRLARPSRQLHRQVVGLQLVAHPEARTMWLDARVPMVRWVFRTA